MASLRQIRADQLDALKSTGPTDPEGKAAARRAALKHGLAGTGIVLPEDEAEAANERWAQWQSSLKPDNAFSDWLVERMAALAIRLERCEQHERALLEIAAARAGRDWDLDRRLAAESLGEALPKAPARVALELRRTTAGRGWLLARWEALGAILDAAGAWDEAQRSLALDLLGTPPALRSGRTRADAAAPALRDLVAAEVAALRAIPPDAADDLDRTAAELGFGPVDRELAMVRRYGRSLARQFDEFRKQVRSAARPYVPPATAPRPAALDPVPAVAPRAEPRSPALNPAFAAEIAATRAEIDALLGRTATADGPGPGRALPDAAPPNAPLPAPNRRARRAIAAGPRDRRRA